MGAMSGAESAAQLTNEFGYRTVTATIAKDASLSDLVDIGDARSVAFHTATSGDSCKLTFQVSPTADGSASNLYHFDGTEVTVPAITWGTCVGCPPSSLSLGAARFIKVRSGTAATPVTQTRQKQITIICKG